MFLDLLELKVDEEKSLERTVFDNYYALRYVDKCPKLSIKLLRRKIFQKFGLQGAKF